MSSQVSPRSDAGCVNAACFDPPKDWVEIVEPKSKTKIYANLETKVCAKHPPEGVNIIKAEDFNDLWWELHDKKTGKYYYYNPEQQKTAWTRPITNGESRRTLIIPVSKLQTFKKLSHAEIKEKRDASTQTIASNLVSTGTQTIDEAVLAEELSNKLRFVSIDNDALNSNNVAYPRGKMSASHIGEKQSPDSIRKNRFSAHPRLHTRFGGSRETEPSRLVLKHDERADSSSQVDSARNHAQNKDEIDHHDSDDPRQSYFGPSPSLNNHRRSIHLQNSTASPFGTNTREENKSISTFKRTFPPNIERNRDLNDQQDPQKITTNNLSQYLVREARSMGIALISDEEMDDEEPDSDEDCAIDEDEDTDLRDDLSSHPEGGDSSSEGGWRSFSDQESPGGSKRSHKRDKQNIPKSPIISEGSTSFAFNELIDDHKDPSAGKSQQLDHRKLVENFKKSRQTSSFGLNDSLGRAYKLDPHNAMQRIKHVADNFLGDKDQSTNLRQISALSTLPRPHKGLRDRQENLPQDIDADYDVVEENCGYYSDSERVQAAQSISEDHKASKLSSGIDSSSLSEHFDRKQSIRGSTFSVESFARENLARHPKKGGLLFNRKVKWSRMISWTKSSIKQPMISSVGSEFNAESIASFKLIQQLMGDRKITISKKYRQILSQAGVAEESYHTGRRSLGRAGSINAQNSSSSNAANNSQNIPDRLRDELAFELTVKGCTKSALRDEIFVQLARQLTDNPNQESTTWGLILLSILLNYFSPSTKFAPFLLSFLETHPHSMAQDVCLPRLEKRLRQNWLSYCRKPADGKEISIVRLSITKWPQYCGVFGESLERIMSLQNCSPFLKTLRLPWILTTLGEKLNETGGTETEGIFRCAADHDLLAQLRLEIDCVDFRKITDAKQLRSLLSNVEDPHVIAGLLKLFFRQLYEPVFPVRIYEACLQNCQDGQMACRLFNECLPNLNKDVVAYLIRMLQTLSQDDKVAHTKMDSSNLSMVWAPNLLRVPEIDGLASMVCGDSSRSGSKWSIVNGNNIDEHSTTTNNHMTPATPSSQSMIFEHARQEMQFIRSLILHLDTSFIKDVV